MAGFTRDREHLLRMAGLFAFGIVVFLLLRTVMVPAGFGRYGHYRAGALDDNRAYPLHYAGRASCEECHSDIVEQRKGSRHARIGCETCHGPLATHVADPTTVKPKRPDTRTTCLVCHTSNPTKPRGFPQILPADHSPEGPCTECHKPHAPAIS